MVKKYEMSSKNNFLLHRILSHVIIKVAVTSRDKLRTEGLSNSDSIPDRNKIIFFSLSPDTPGDLLCTLVEGYREFLRSGKATGT